MPTPTENQFISFWRSHVGDGVLPHSRHAARAVLDFREAGLVEPSIDESFWILTSRGADKLATADAIGYDPSAKPEPAPIALTRPCSECNGEGRKSLGVYDQGADPDPESWVEQTYTCPTCNGSRVVPRLQLRPAIDFVVQGGGLDRVADSLRRIAKMAKDAGVRVVHMPARHGMSLGGVDSAMERYVEASAQAERERACVGWFTPADVIQRPLNPNSFHVGLAPNKAADGYIQDTLVRHLIDKEYESIALKWSDKMLDPAEPTKPPAEEWIDFKCCADVEHLVGRTVEYKGVESARPLGRFRMLRAGLQDDTAYVYGNGHKFRCGVSWLFRAVERNPCRGIPETRPVFVNDPYGVLREPFDCGCYPRPERLPSGDE